ncbi:hypothetical protein EB118_16725 [bacterium]|nr:hypothetical protein [bacterium]
MEKLPPHIIEYIIQFVPPYKPTPRLPHYGLEKQIENLKRSPKLTSMAFYRLDDYIFSDSYDNEYSGFKKLFTNDGRVYKKFL